MYESVNLKLIPVPLKVVIEKVKNILIQCAIQLIFEWVHLLANYSIINLKSNFAPLWNKTVIWNFLSSHSPCLNPYKYPVSLQWQQYESGLLVSVLLLQIKQIGFSTLLL